MKILEESFQRQNILKQVKLWLMVCCLAIMADTRAVSSRYDLYIGPRRFLVDSKIGHVLIQGDEYTIYYLKNSNKIVSAELISRAK